MIYINHQILTLTKAIPTEHKIGLSWRWAPIDERVCLYQPRQCCLHWQLYHHREIQHCDQPCDSLPGCLGRVSRPRTWAGRRWEGLSNLVGQSQEQFEDVLHERKVWLVLIMSPLFSFSLFTSFNGLGTTGRGQLQQLSSLSSSQGQLLDKDITGF